MNIFYDIPTENWYHNHENAELFAGSAEEEIRYKKDHSNQPLIPITIFPGNRMLAVGILTVSNPKKESGLGGNLTLFRDLSLYLLKHGILAYVFTGNALHPDSLRGYVFSSISNKWIECKVPFPDIVYNRIPSRSYEASEEFQHLITHFKDYRMNLFNPCFIDKYVMFEALNEDGFLTNHLPPTTVLRNSDCLYAFLETYRHIYLKPCKGSQGKGIYTIIKNDDDTLLFNSLKHSESFPDFASFWETKKGIY